MRLIDADAIKKLDWITERGMADCGEEFVYLSAIDKMPTMDAIPISFIEEKMEDIDTIFLKLLDRLEGEGAYKKLLHEYNALRDLIRAWKERQDDEAH